MRGSDQRGKDMGLLKRARESKDDPAFLIEDGKRRMGIQTEWMRRMNDSAAQLDSFLEISKNKEAFTKYYKDKDLFHSFSYEMLYYPLSEEESKAMGEHYSSLYKHFVDSRMNFQALSLINTAYFLLRDRYGLKALEEPKETDLSNCLSMFVYEEFWKTFAMTDPESETAKRYDLSDKPVASALTWGNKYIFEAGGKFNKDFPDLKAYWNKNVFDGNIEKTMKTVQRLHDKKFKEYNRELKNMGLSLDETKKMAEPSVGRGI